MPPLSDAQRQALGQAADWYARLMAGQPDDATQRAWQAWLQADPANRWAWQQAEHLQQQVQRLPGNLAGQALERARHLPLAGRRRVLGSLLLLAAAAPLGWRASEPARHAWLADQHTARGQWRSLELDDGSQLQLDSGTAVDMRFDERQRLLVLRQGRLMLTSPPHADPRPLEVETPEGRIRALGTRFSVRRQAQGSEVVVYQHAVRITPLAGSPQELEAGHWCSFDSRRIGTPQASPFGQDAWTRRQLIVNDQPLAQVLDELRPYVSGWMGCEPAIAHLHLSGTFHLDDSRQALQAMASSLNLRIRRLGPYWARLESAR